MANPIVNAVAVAVQAIFAPMVASTVDLGADRWSSIRAAVAAARRPEDAAGTFSSPTAGAARPHSDGGPARAAYLKPAFKLVFLSVLAITVLCGIAQLILAGIWPQPTANQQAAFEAMGFAWKAGLGAILGLLGGKVT